MQKIPTPTLWHKNKFLVEHWEAGHWPCGGALGYEAGPCRGGWPRPVFQANAERMISCIGSFGDISHHFPAAFEDDIQNVILFLNFCHIKIPI